MGSLRRTSTSLPRRYTETTIAITATATITTTTATPATIATITSITSIAIISEAYASSFSITFTWAFSAVQKQHSTKRRGPATQNDSGIFDQADTH
ncbi:unnamed protein product [Clonostachys solani]|uniref:Uncharacterized protein n=1 Tax=Clonostachys solani TaxID=160281 RepID=A0A9N9ZMF8_9HYPO|nr:unnamed protein product [Clonostachys solani]